MELTIALVIIVAFVGIAMYQKLNSNLGEVVKEQQMYDTMMEDEEIKSHQRIKAFNYGVEKGATKVVAMLNEGFLELKDGKLVATEKLTKLREDIKNGAEPLKLTIDREAIMEVL